MKLLGHLPNGVVVMMPLRDGSGRVTDFSFVYLNPAGEGITGFRFSDLRDKTLLQLLPGHMANGIFTRYGQVLESGKGQVLEYENTCKDRRRWFRVHCVRFEEGILTTFEDISEQKRAEVKLRENQHFLQSVADTAPEIIYVFDLPAGRNVYVNRQLEEVLGYPVSQAKDFSFETLVHPDDLDVVRNRFRMYEQVSDSDVVESEFRIKTADNRWRWLYVRSVVFRRNSEGKPLQILGSARDITKRKETEEELRRQQLLLTTIADATPDTILLVDVIEDRVIYANHLVSPNPDKAGNKFSAKDDAERRRWVLEQDLFKRTAFMRGFTQTHDNEVREMEYRVKDAHGNWRWIWTRGKVFRRLPDGRVWQIIIVGQDVTDKKENQRQLRQANKELKIQQETLYNLNNQLEERVQIRTQELAESAGRFRMLLEAMPQMTWTAQPDGTIDYYNQQWYNYTGVDPHALSDGYAPLVIHPEDLSETGQRWMHSVETGEPFEQENRMRRASDGSWRWHLNRALPIRNAGGEIRLWTGTSTDTHDLKMALENLTEVNAALDNFVHMAAHDLRSPVNNLKLLFGLHDQARSPEESATIYQAMEESVRRLDNTVHSLIEVLEVQNSSRVPAREVRFGEVVDYIVKDYSAELEKCRGRIETDFSQCPSIQYVEAYLYSIVRNFLSNAIKYRSPHRDLVVKVSSRRGKGLVMLEVSDNGIGINLNKYGKDLFNPFSRFTTQAYGKGLGLHLVRNMVEKDGGSIRVESEPDTGTTFYVTLKEYPVH